MTIYVSIPIGFSSSLQRRSGRCSRPERSRVSIPIGFSSSLQPSADRTVSPYAPGFNPYRVFKFVATWPPCGLDRGAERVSIPIGFSSSLQRICWTVGRTDSRHVSIPIGFSSSLQLGFLSTFSAPATVFQSLSGFQVRCN